MENFKTKIGKNKKFIFFLLIGILISLLIVFFIFRYKNNNKSLSEGSTTLNTIISLIDKINNTNNNLKECISGYTINSKTTIDVLNNSIESLENTKDSLRSMILTDDYSRELSYKIISSIESTQNLYNYCILSLNLDDSSAISESITKINELEYDVIKNYDELNDLGLSIALNDDALSFFTSLQNFLTSIESNNKKNQIKYSKSSDFIMNFKTYTSDFSLLIQDLEPAITKAREDERSFNPILDDIYNKEALYIEIKHKVNSLAVPDGYLSYYNSLNDIFRLYSTYLKALKVAIVYEKSSDNYSLKIGRAHV